MATGREDINDYFEWLCDYIFTDQQNDSNYWNLLTYLFQTPFEICMVRDSNRVEDGLELRRRYISVRRKASIMDHLNGECSIFELMVALAIKCETEIMGNEDIGNRTGRWFWEMVHSLGLSNMDDKRYSEQIVRSHIRNFMDRNYSENGAGGLFTVRHPNGSMPDTEIWYQMLWHIDDVLKKEGR